MNTNSATANHISMLYTVDLVHLPIIFEIAVC